MQVLLLLHNVLVCVLVVFLILSLQVIMRALFIGTIQYPNMANVMAEKMLDNFAKENEMTALADLIS